MTPTNRSLLAAFALALAPLLLFACGSGEAGPSRSEREVDAQRLLAKARSDASRLRGLLERPWAARLDEGLRQQLFAHFRDLESYVLRPDELPLDRLPEGELDILCARGRELLEKRDLQMAAAFDSLALVEATANQAELLRHGLSRALSAAGIPLNEEFPARNRVRDGYLREQESLLGELTAAARALAKDRDATRLRMIETNLARLVADGNRVLTELHIRLRDVDNTASRMRQIEGRLEFARRVLAAPDQADETVALRQRTATALQTAESIFPSLVERWEPLRRAYLTERSGSNDELKAFQDALDGALRELNESVRRLASELKITDPADPTIGR